MTPATSHCPLAVRFKGQASLCQIQRKLQDACDRNISAIYFRLIFLMNIKL